MEFIIECECGNVWNMDSEPTPEECIGAVWRIGTSEDEEPNREDVDWGVWVDQDGNQIDNEEFQHRTYSACTIDEDGGVCGESYCSRCGDNECNGANYDRGCRCLNCVLRYSW